jgi:serine protease Do
MIHRFLLCMFLFSMVISLGATVQTAESKAGSGANAGSNEHPGESWDWSYDSDEGGGTSYLGVDVDDVSTERLAELKLKEEHGAEITMVDQDAPAGKAGLHEHDVIVSLNGSAVESAAQLRRMIKETPPGRVVSIGISRDGQPMTIKAQLADRRKSSWGFKGKYEIPPMPEIAAIPEFDMPVSVVIVHSSLRSGLMVENLTSQLGDFFGVKDGKGVLVRTVEKGSRGEKAGFRAGDVVVKVNDQPVHDTSDFTHALRSTSGSAAAVTVMREKREQNLTLTLPDKKDSGSLLEESFDADQLTAQLDQAMSFAGDEIADLDPAMTNMARALRSQETARSLEDRQRELQDQRQARELRRRALADQERARRQELRERGRELRHRLAGQWAEI